MRNKNLLIWINGLFLATTNLFATYSHKNNRDSKIEEKVKFQTLFYDRILIFLNFKKRKSDINFSLMYTPTNKNKKPSFSVASLNNPS